jgi:hypothetical protein
MYMYVPGILTGVLMTSLFWLAVICLREMQFNDALWDARAEAIENRRAGRRG